VELYKKLFVERTYYIKKKYIMIVGDFIDTVRYNLGIHFKIIKKFGKTVQ